MKSRLQKQLAEIFDEVEDEFPDKSTEFLLEVAAERARAQGIYRGCDCADIAEALG